MIAERVIINADDLGISEAVNDSIFDLMAKRRVTSATILANGPAFRHAVSRVKHFGECSFGAHLNLTQFAPLTDSPVLSDPDGNMSQSLMQGRFGARLLSAMYEELCAQVSLLASVGVSVSHLDSHHHIHTLPQILPLIKALQKRFGIRKVRISKNIYTSQQPVSSSLARKKTAYNWVLRNVFATRTTDGFTELLSYRSELDRRAPPHRSVELMAHPGAPYAGGEVDALESDWLAKSGIAAKLINYNHL